MPNNEDPKKDMSIAEEAGLPENWVPIDSTPIVPSNMAAGTNPYGGGSLPPNFNLQPDTLSTNYKGPGIPAVRLMPVQGNPAINAQTQSIVEKAISEIPPTVIPASTPGVTDGLIHGQGGGGVSIGSWESDPAYGLMRDDFFNAGTSLNGTAIPTASIGQYNWLIAGTLATGGGMSGGAPSNAGFIGWGNTTTQQQAGWLLLPTGNNGDTTTNHATNCMALLENPPWKMTWIFQVAPTTTDRTTTPLITERAMYVGLTGPGYAAQIAGPVSRPNQFMGLRYDTSVTPGALTVTNVTAGSGVAVYTFTALTGTNAGAGNGFVGMRFTTTGFTHANNDVTSALCTASTTSSITLVNASGGTTTDSGTATGPIGPSDTHFVLEVVNNPIYSVVGRNNQQGTTLVTNVVPTIGVWHRLDIICTVAGQVTITLDGSSVNTLTATCPVTTISPGSGLAEGGVSAGIGFVAWTPGGTTPSGPWNAGSVVAISGFTGTQAGLNGTVTLWECDSGSEIHWYSSTGVGTGSGGSATLIGYPTWTPLVMFGNDDTASPTSTMNMNVDFFSFIWNPGVGGGTGTPVATKPRYF